MGCEALKEFCSGHNVEARLKEPMAGHTYLKIGGPADIALFPDRDSLPGLLKILVSEGTPYSIIGGGTNLLIRDGGIEGAAIFTGRMNNIIMQNEEHLLAQSGCSLQKVMNLCEEQGLSGMEGLAGIPGLVGGAVAGNAGSFGNEIKDVVEFVDLLMPDGSEKTLSGDEMGFGYRKSRVPKGAVILCANISLKKDDTHDVKKRIAGFREMKKKDQPLSQPSAGCVFKNPEGESAGRLIDQAGCKGLRSGGIEVSRQHANFFLNTGNGTSADYLRLIEIVTGKVSDRFGIILEPEIKIIGRDK